MLSPPTQLVFADKLDYRLMAVGIVFCLIQAILPPIVWLFMGQFVTNSIRREIGKCNRTVAFERWQNNDSWIVGDNTSLFRNESLANVNQTKLDQEFKENAPLVFWMMLGLSLITFAAAFLQRLTWEISAVRQVFRVKKAYISKLLHMDVAWLESRHSGEVAAMLHDHADSIYQGIADHLPMTIFIIANLIATLIVCFLTQWKTTLVMLTAIPILIITRIIFTKWFCKTLEDEQQLQGKLANLVQETFNCIRTVISFGGQKQTIGQYDKLVKESGRLTSQRLKASSIYDALAQVFITEMIFTGAMVYGMFQLATTRPGELAALAVNMLYMCVTSISIGFHMNGVSAAKQNTKELCQILNEAPSIESETNLHKESIMKPKGSGAIRFDNIFFTYPSRPDIEVLKGISFSVKAGEHLAIVGSSGSGKSTITALLLRFYDPQLGSITLDGVNVLKMNPDDLRAQIALVSQEPVLFDGSISDNIRYGRLDAAQADVNEAARKVEAWQFINALPQGMNTRVGDRGMQLSGGQKQRVAIARAVIRSPSVMIFDEATSALDNKHEAEVQKAIDIVSEGLTTITIAHRLTTVRHADRIIVLEHGEIVEEGPPDELLTNSKGIFHRMYTDQRLIMESFVDEPASDKLAPTFSIADLPMLDVEAKRRAWARSSLGACKNNKLGRSYSIMSSDRDRLALPVMSKKRSRLHETFQSTVMEVPTVIPDDDFTEATHSSKLNSPLLWEYAVHLFSTVHAKPAVDHLPGKKTNLGAVWRLLKSYKKGYVKVFCAIPVTMVRAVLFLLVCFQVSEFLRIAECDLDDMSSSIIYTGCLFAGLITVKTILEATGRLLVAQYGHGFCEQMRLTMFKSLLRQGAAYFDEEKNSPGKLSHRVMSDTASLNRIIGDKLDMLLPAVVCATMSIVLAIYFNWKLALLCAFQFPAFFLFRLVEFRETSKRQRQMVEEEKKAANLATVVLSNMSTIKAYTLQEHFNRIFCDALRPLQKAMLRQSYISSFVFASQFSFSYILIAITLHFGKEMMSSNEIRPYEYIRVVLLTQFGANFLSQLISSVSDLSKARIAGENILAVINESAVMDNMKETGETPTVAGHLRLNQVQFRYPSRPIVPILRGLNLRIKAGQTVALVGPSGSGKSTIVQLIQRMYDPTVGQVTLDNHDLRSLNPAHLRRQVVSVSQEPMLFSFSLHDNIAYGLEPEEATLERVQQAAKDANIHDFIISLPQGYDTQVGEWGAQLSGGQKQRIAIARAIVRKPVVLLLDEATAALDSASEKAVQAALETASKDCTCIVVAHRLSTIRKADEIIVLVDGDVVERGSHHKLMELRGLYFEMTQAQQSLEKH